LVNQTLDEIGSTPNSQVSTTDRIGSWKLGAGH
jgi:hypothetical protein